MHSPSPNPAQPADSLRADLRGTAREGAVTFAGAAFSTALGFALTLVLARALGALNSGVVLQAIAAFSIVLAFARAGMDTAAVWILPRLRTESPELVRGACTGLILPTAAIGLVLSLLWWLLGIVRHGQVLYDPGVSRALTAIMWSMPVGSVMLVALAATRAFGGVVPYNLIGNVLVPGIRPFGVLLVTAMGGSVFAASFVWALPQLPGLVLALWVLYAQIRRFERRHQVRGAWRPTRALQARIFGFALPRTLASGLEQSTKWFDVVLVGVIAGAASAGVYGVTSRFVSAGIIVLTALRIVVAPRFSAYLGQGRFDDVQALYKVTASWILLFGAPIYILFGFYAHAILSKLGPGFEDGVSSMVVLCIGAVVMLAGGNIQSLLLMSGHSGWSAVNKFAVFAVNVVADLILIPRIGYFGAAVAWAFCMVLDTALAAWQVYRFTGITPAAGRIASVGLAVTGCVAVPSLAMIALLGDNLLSLAAAAGLSAAMLLGYCILDRHRLHMTDLLAMLPVRGRVKAAESMTP